MSPVLQAEADSVRDATQANFWLDRYRGPISVLVDSAGRQELTFRARGQMLLHVVTHASVLEGPVRLTFLTHGQSEADAAPKAFSALKACLATRRDKRSAAWPTRTINLRDALIALDGHAVGATHRDTSVVLFGLARTRESWSSLTNPLKTHAHRALQRGRQLMNGGYRQFLR